MPAGGAGWPAARDRRHPASTPAVASSRPGRVRAWHAVRSHGPVPAGARLARRGRPRGRAVCGAGAAGARWRGAKVRATVAGAPAAGYPGEDVPGCAHRVMLTDRSGMAGLVPRAAAFSR